MKIGDIDLPERRLAAGLLALFGLFAFVRMKMAEEPKRPPSREAAEAKAEACERAVVAFGVRDKIADYLTDGLVKEGAAALETDEAHDLFAAWEVAEDIAERASAECLDRDVNPDRLLESKRGAQV